MGKSSLLINIQFDDSDAALASPEKVMKEDAKQSFKTNILQLLLIADPQLIPIVKQMINVIIEIGGGYMVIWPELMTVLLSLTIHSNRNSLKSSSKRTTPIQLKFIT